jgi:hypothetical protein
MDRTERERMLEGALEGRDWEGLLGIPASTGWLLRRLGAHMQKPDPLRRWRALEALGVACGKAAGVREPSQEFLRSLFWSMNDESGNLFRMAPEAIGEMLSVLADLREEFAPLLPQFLIEEPFEVGTLWALCRLVDNGWRPRNVVDDWVSAGLDHLDPRRRGLSIRLSRKIGLPCNQAAIEQASFEDYDFLTGQLVLVTEPPGRP